MAITYPLVFPAGMFFAKTKFRMLTADGMNQSPFTFSQEVFLYPGAAWSCDISLPAQRRDKAEKVIAFMGQLKGRFGSFLLGDQDGRAPLGVATGTPLVNGGSQTGATLATKGWTHTITNILKAGDYVQLGSGSTARFYKNLKDVNSDGSGNVTLDIWPNLRSSPSDGDTITLLNTVTQMRLVAPFEWDANEVSTYGISFSAIEKL